MKRFLKKLHLWLSIPAGIVITIICLSGAILVFEQEILEQTGRRLYFTGEPPASDTGRPAERLSPGELMARVTAAAPDSLQLGGLQIPGDARYNYRIEVKNRRHTSLFVDPYTAEIRGTNETGKGFFPAMRRLHRWLLGTYQRGSDRISPGKLTVGVATLFMAVILISGLWIWVPRNRKMLRNRLSVKFDKGRRRLWYDLHVSAGFYATGLLLVLALTGLTWSFGWYRTAFYKALGVEQTGTGAGGSKNAPAARTVPDGSNEKSGRNGRGEGSEKRQARHGGGRPERRAVPESPDYAVWDRVLAEMEKRYPVYERITISNGTVSVSTGGAGNMHAADLYAFDPQSGAVTSETRYADQPRQTKIRGWIYTLHVGGWAGTFSKVLTLLASLIGATLPPTGYYLWIKRPGRRNKVKTSSSNSRPTR